MSKKELSDDQVKHLRNLGINAYKFTVSDLLDLLPKEISCDGIRYPLEICNLTSLWYVSYGRREGYRTPITVMNEELINSLYSMLCWCIENRYVRTEIKINKAGKYVTSIKLPIMDEEYSDTINEIIRSAYMAGWDESLKCQFHKCINNKPIKGDEPKDGEMVIVLCRKVKGGGGQVLPMSSSFKNGDWACKVILESYYNVLAWMSVPPFNESEMLDN